MKIKKFINNWYNISVGLAVISAVIAIFGVDDITQKLLWGSIAILFLHFFEEFGFPGGFPLMGMKVLMNSKERDSSKWNCNNLNSMFGNWGFLFFLYILPLIFTDVRFLTLAAMMFLFAEFLMHVVLFNVKQKTIYNPGLITALFGLTPLGVYYFANVYEGSMYAWYDFIIAVAYFIAVFWFCFRSPLYWGLGSLKGYALTRRSAYGMAAQWN